MSQPGHHMYQKRRNYSTRRKKNKYSATTKNFNLSVIYICNVVEPNPMKNCTLCWHPIDGQLDHQIFVWHQSLVCILAIAIFKQSQTCGQAWELPFTQDVLGSTFCCQMRNTLISNINRTNSANWNKFIHNFISSYCLHRWLSNTLT